MDQNSYPQDTRGKKWIKPAIIAGLVIIVAIITTVIIVSLNKPSDEPKTPQTAQKGPDEFEMKTIGSAVKYAGNTVYDACGLVPFDTIRSTVNNYQKLLDMNGTDQKPTDPLVIEHNYIDRDIARPLGNDDQSRSTGTTFGGNGTQGVGAFLSDSDSNCWYGQGKDLSLGTGKTFAKAYVIQKPTPLSADLTAYLATLNKAASQDGMDVYVEPQADSSGFYTGIVAKPTDGAVAVFKAANKELAEKGTVAMSETLSHKPKGPMNLTYPQGWVAMPNPCSLLTADDFQQITGKPASALAEDTMTLNEIGGRIMQRRCERLEVERLDGSPITKTYAVVRVGNSEEAAKKYVDEVKKNTSDTIEIQPIKQKISLADDVYVTVAHEGDKVVSHELNMRVGNGVITLAAELESGADKSVDAFVARMLPTAKAAAEKYRNQ